MDTITLPSTPDELPPCELEGLEPPCEVCDGTGEVTDAPGRYGRPVHPCTNCDAYDVRQELLRDLYTESRED